MKAGELMSKSEKRDLALFNPDLSFLRRQESSLFPCLIKLFLEKEKKMRKLITICLMTMIFISGYALAGTWTTPQPVGGVINTNADEGMPFLSSDGLSLYFTRWSDHAANYQATRSTPSGSFTSVRELTGLGAGTFFTWVSPDNLRMYYSGPGWNINMTQRNSVTDDWSMGTGINSLNSLGTVCEASLTADELTVVFVGGDLSGTVGKADLYMANRPDKNSPFGNIVALTNVNSSFGDLPPYISPDGLSLYFGTDRNESSQIFKSTRDTLSDLFGTPQHLSIFDMPNGVGSPCLSNDGTELYFVSRNQNGNANIYVSYNVPEPATILILGLGAMILKNNVKFAFCAHYALRHLKEKNKNNKRRRLRDEEVFNFISDFNCVNQH
jgi:hypothetical protein